MPAANYRELFLAAVERIEDEALRRKTMDDVMTLDEDDPFLIGVAKLISSGVELDNPDFQSKLVSLVSGLRGEMVDNSVPELSLEHVMKDDDGKRH